MVFLIVALVCAALFAGASSYITFVEHPARMSCGTAVALAEFRPSYRRATVMQASLAIIGFVAGVVGFLVRGGDWSALAGALLLGAVVPWTLIVILPTNKQLLDESIPLEKAEILLRRWGRLHAARTVLSLLAFALLAHVAFL